jgi:hypothetical protein
MWLDCDHVEADAAAALIRPADEDLLEAYPVSTAVNRAANDFEALIAPAAGDATQEETAPRVPARSAKPKKVREPDGQASLF